MEATEGGRWVTEVTPDQEVPDFRERIPEMPIVKPFELDPFQKQAILQVEGGHNVLVAAHTSAGKTVVAEYAISLALDKSKRAVYTSPVKALSNQKFRDFKEIFDDVGLITGDTQINEDASCLIMTTEILRSRLYQGSEMLQDLEWVIMDEVHYINDVIRGVVWEEVIIMLPDHVKLLLLSATVPNALELAEWIGHIKQRPIYVVTTSRRPVPLKHYLFTQVRGRSSKGLQLLMDETGRFNPESYDKSKRNLEASDLDDEQLLTSTLDMLTTDNKLPAIFFVFSKKKIDSFCASTKGVTLTTDREQNEIDSFFQSSVSKLTTVDQNLEQVTKLRELLKRGIGVHHSGSIPLLKEVVECLFHRGLVKVRVSWWCLDDCLKVLFATETLATGVNLPAKTVIFDELWKFDGVASRFVYPGEYIQMAGRAGRRGMDTAGHVIVTCAKSMPDLYKLHTAMQGRQSHLRSKFRLTYSMMLNMMRYQRADVQEMMRKSFHEFHTKREAARQLLDISKKMDTLQGVECRYCQTDLGEYYQKCTEYYNLQEQLMTQVLSVPAGLELMAPGRLLLVKRPGGQVDLGVVLKKVLSDKFQPNFLTLVNCDVSEENSPEDEGIHPPGPNTPTCHQGQRSPLLLTITASDIKVICRGSLSVKADAILKNLEYCKKSGAAPSRPVTSVLEKLWKKTNRRVKDLSSVNLQEHLHGDDIGEIHLAIQQLNQDLLNGKYVCKQCPKFKQHFSQHNHNQYIKEKHRELTFLTSDAHQTLLPEYTQMMQVLRDLGYIDAHDIVLAKGRAASCLNTHELVVTELVARDLLNDLDPDEIAALLSCFVFEISRSKKPRLSDSLQTYVILHLMTPYKLYVI
ncbi:superkiller complex protein 2-like [Physella acuta]|uniref:superkiller complex protein 2-like n=1 Tax=Physella acuta TaxID=109671 RepID=UPI0027DD4355|nr:superkiller complex protein 2-like [Physella acuta]